MSLALRCHSPDSDTRILSTNSFGSGGAGTASAAEGEEGGGGSKHGEGVDIEGERLGTIEIVRGEHC